MKEKNISYLQRTEQLINAGRCKRGSSHEQIYTLLSFRNLLHQHKLLNTAKAGESPLSSTSKMQFW